MNSKKNKEKIFKNGNRKVNIGVRASAELKLKLSEESNSIGKTISGYCENILINRFSLQNKTLTDLAEDLKQKNNSLESSLLQMDVSNYKKNIQKLNDENSLLKKRIIELNSNLQIYSEPQLLHLFNKVKGKSDKIKTNNGEISIIYNSPIDVLFALIHSFKI